MARELMLIAPDTDLKGRLVRRKLTGPGKRIFSLRQYCPYDFGKENFCRNTQALSFIATTPACEIRVARLQVGDNWDPEPGAPGGGCRQSRGKQHHLDIKAEPVKLGQAKFSDYKICRPDRHDDV